MRTLRHVTNQAIYTSDRLWANFNLTGWAHQALSPDQLLTAADSLESPTERALCRGGRDMLAALQPLTFILDCIAGTGIQRVNIDKLANDLGVRACGWHAGLVDKLDPSEIEFQQAYNSALVQALIDSPEDLGLVGVAMLSSWGRYGIMGGVIGAAVGVLIGAVAWSLRRAWSGADEVNDLPSVCKEFALSTAARFAVMTSWQPGCWIAVQAARAFTALVKATIFGVGACTLGAYYLQTAPVPTGPAASHLAGEGTA